MLIDNPDCQRARYEVEFNNLKIGCKNCSLISIVFPITCLQPRVSFDEGHSWDKYGFTSVPLFVDGALVEAGVETQIMTWVLLFWKVKETERPEPKYLFQRTLHHDFLSLGQSILICKMRMLMLAFIN